MVGQTLPVNGAQSDFILFQVPCFTLRSGGGCRTCLHFAPAPKIGRKSIPRSYELDLETFLHLSSMLFLHRHPLGNRARAVGESVAGGDAASKAAADSPIYMWSVCKKCGRTTTPLVPMSEDTWKFSLGKFLEVR